MNTTLIVAAIVFGFVGLSRSIQAASGVKPKPMPKKGRWTVHPIIWLFVILYIAGVLFPMIADGGLDFDFLF